MLDRARAQLQSREIRTVIALAGLILVALAAIFLWRPADTSNDPYEEQLASWTIEQTNFANPFLGYGVFTYRPDWSGPAQSFNGPVLLRVDDADTPFSLNVDGEGALARKADGKSAALTVGAGQGGASGALTLKQGDTLSLPPNTPFSVATGAGQGVRIIAIVISDAGPPATPGIEQVEWRSWDQGALPAAPFTVSLADVQLSGGESYSFSTDVSPVLLAVEGLGSGALSIGVTVEAGAADYQRVTSLASWDLTEPASSSAARTAITPLREKRMEVGSGVSVQPGSSVQLHNRSLVDGTAVRLIEIRG